MRYRLVLAAVVLQVLALAYLGGEREWVLRTGRPIQLRTAPIDPNDPMRGEYVRLTYDISSVPRALCRDGLVATKPDQYGDYRRDRDRRVYATLKINDTGIAELVSLSDREPADGLYLRGRVDFTNPSSMNVRYGIEAMFMEQGKARLLENMQRNERPGVPLDMEVAVGTSGIAVLKGYKWEALGILLTFDRAPAATPQFNPLNPDRSQQLVTGVQVELKNYSPEEVAIVDLPDGGSFRLVSDNRGQEIFYRWVGEARPAPPSTGGKVIVLKPGQSYFTKLDFTAPQWFVTPTMGAPETRKPRAMREVTDPWTASFRLEYAPPSKENCTGLPHADLIQHVKLRSRIFYPTANRD